MRMYGTGHLVSTILDLVGCNRVSLLKWRRQYKEVGLERLIDQRNGGNHHKLTRAGNLGNWTQEEIITALHTGVTPEGKRLDPENMPWTITLRMTDDELSAIWLYLNSLPPVESES